MVTLEQLEVDWRQDWCFSSSWCDDQVSQRLHVTGSGILTLQEADAHHPAA